MLTSLNHIRAASGNPLRESRITRVGITYAGVTFSQIADALQEQCASHETDLLAVLSDFRDYLAHAKLLDTRHTWLGVFPCGVSHYDNARLGIYYEHATRPSRQGLKFIGIYRDKQVTHVGKIEHVIVVTNAGPSTSYFEEKGKATDAVKNLIQDTVATTPYYDLKATSHRFYVVDHFVPTDCRKISPGGIWGYRTLDIAALTGPDFAKAKVETAEDLAAAIFGRTWT